MVVVDFNTIARIAKVVAMEDAEPALLVIAAFGAASIGLVCGLLTRARTAAAAMLAAAVLGIGLSYFSIENMRTEMRREIAQSQGEQSTPEANVFFSAEQQRELSQAVSSSIKVEEQEGYWLTLGTLGLATLFALLTLVTVRRADITAPS
jgi:hypothetical protein